MLPAGQLGPGTRILGPQLNFSEEAWAPQPALWGELPWRKGKWVHRALRCPLPGA